MKHLGSLVPFVLMSSLISADGRVNTQLRNFEHRLDLLESKNSSCLITPAARPSQKCDWGAYLRINPLLLKAQENGLEFAALTQIPPEFTVDSLGFMIFDRTKYQNLHFPLDWGFRVALGMNLPHDGWDIQLSWMRFYTDAKKRALAGPNQFLTPLFLNTQNFINLETTPTSFSLQGAQQGYFTKGSSHWTLHLNEIDLELGRQFFVSKWLTLKPHAGLRTAWVRQNDHILYENFIVHISGLPPNYMTKISQHMGNNYWGLGIVAGLDTQWGLTCGWSIFADFEASLLYGYFDLAVEEVDEGFYTSGTDLLPFKSPLYNAHEFTHVNRFITNFLAGLRYDTFFCDEEYHLGFQAGWEMHFFFGQNQFFKFVGGNPFPGEAIANHGDLTLQGLSAEVRFDF